MIFFFNCPVHFPLFAYPYVSPYRSIFFWSDDNSRTNQIKSKKNNLPKWTQLLLSWWLKKFFSVEFFQIFFCFINFKKKITSNSRCHTHKNFLFWNWSEMMMNQTHDTCSFDLCVCFFLSLILFFWLEFFHNSSSSFIIMMIKIQLNEWMNKKKYTNNVTNTRFKFQNEIIREWERKQQQQQQTRHKKNVVIIIIIIIILQSCDMRQKLWGPENFFPFLFVFCCLLMNWRKKKSSKLPATMHTKKTVWKWWIQTFVDSLKMNEWFLFIRGKKI